MCPLCNCVLAARAVLYQNLATAGCCTVLHPEQGSPQGLMFCKRLTDGPSWVIADLELIWSASSELVFTFHPSILSLLWLNWVLFLLFQTFLIRVKSYWRTSLRWVQGCTNVWPPMRPDKRAVLFGWQCSVSIAHNWYPHLCVSNASPQLTHFTGWTLCHTFALLYSSYMEQSSLAQQYST